VAEHLLHVPQVDPTRDEMGGEGMAERVRPDVGRDPGPVGVLGAGRRLSNGEVFGELGGYGAVLRSSEFGYEGQLGGFAFSLGYRIIY
jgi:hypothetical protein